MKNTAVFTDAYHAVFEGKQYTLHFECGTNTGQSADLVKLFLTDHNCAIPSGCMFPKLNMMMGKVYLSKEIYNESNI